MNDQAINPTAFSLGKQDLLLRHPETSLLSIPLLQPTLRHFHHFSLPIMIMLLTIHGLTYCHSLPIPKSNDGLIQAPVLLWITEKSIQLPSALVNRTYFPLHPETSLLSIPLLQPTIHHFHHFPLPIMIMLLSTHKSTYCYFLPIPKPNSGLIRASVLLWMTEQSIQLPSALVNRTYVLPTTSGNLTPQYPPPPTNPSLFSSFPAYHSCAIIDSQINLSSFSLANPESQRWVNSSTSTVIDPLINSSSFFPNPKPQLVAKPRVSPDCLYIMIR